MSYRLPTYSPTTDKNYHDSQLAKLSSAEHDYYKQNYVPFENALISQSSGGSNLVGTAQGYTGNIPQGLSAIGQRANARYGANMTAGENASQARNSALSAALGKGQMANSTRRGEHDMNMAMQSQLAALGRGLSTQAVGGLQTSAANEASRQAQELAAERAYEQSQAQQQASTMSVLGGLGMAAIMASDERLKENIEKIENPIEKLMALEGYTYNWKEDGSSDVGVIAQEVEKVMPELIQEEDGIKKVKYHGLIALMLAAVKELVSEEK